MPDETRLAGTTLSPAAEADLGVIAENNQPRETGARAGETATQTLAWKQPARAPEAAPRAARRLGEQRSLFGEILDWMLAPLLLLWPLSMTITYVVAQNIANAPFDRNLEQSVDVLASHLRVERGEIRLQLPLPARDLLRAEPPESVLFRIVDTGGRLVAGDADFASNAGIANAANRNLATASANWVMEREALVAIPPKAPDQVSSSLSQGDIRQLFIMIFLVLPAAAIAMGVAIWMRRRA